MKLHDLHPAAGSNRPRTRVGRGIAGGKGKTAGRGTKGQKARAGGSIPARFEGGQTPLHIRIPKLRGFKNRFGKQFEIVNLGDIAQAIESGKLETGETAKAAKGKAAPVTVNQELLRDAGLVRRLDRPLKVLAGGAEVTTALFVVADAFSRTARTQIEAAGGTVSVLEVPTESRPALGVERPPRRPRASELAAEKASRPAPAPKETPAAEAKPKRPKAEKGGPGAPKPRDARDDVSSRSDAGSADAATGTGEAISTDPTTALAPDGTDEASTSEASTSAAPEGTDEAESGSPES
jgi:large subunit ribosomal protein L15